MNSGLPIALAVASAMLAAWAAAGAAWRIGLVDHPGPRKPHRRPTPLGGGVGIAAGVTAGLLAAGTAVELLPSLWALVLLGLVDDARDLRARTRLAGQAAAVLPILPLHAPAIGLPRPVEVFLALLLVVIVINAVKCLDCADGVTGAVTVAAAFSLGWVGGWEAPVGALALVVAASASGFLILNAPPARCFLGEGGSTGLGFLLASLCLAAAGSVPERDALTGVMAASCVLMVPVLDFALVHVRRMRLGIRRLADLMASVGMDHLPHRLRAAGLGPRAVAVASAAAVGVSGIAAQVVLRAALGVSLLTLIATGAVFVLGEALLLLHRRHSSSARLSTGFRLRREAKRVTTF